MRKLVTAVDRFRLTNPFTVNPDLAADWFSGDPAPLNAREPRYLGTPVTVTHLNPDTGHIRVQQTSRRGRVTTLILHRDQLTLTAPSG